jgi:hypothetical protein
MTALRTSSMTGVVVVSLGALGLAGCGGDGGTKAAAGPAATTLPTFPERFPLPRGAVVRKGRDDGSTMNVEALVPGEIREVAESLLDGLPQAGFDLGEGDSEEHEAESHFSGNGFAGFFKLNTVGGCAGANTLAVVLTRS